MKLRSIEPTPSPNAMKLNVDETASTAKTYTADQPEEAPEIIQRLLAVDGVKSVFRVADFLSVERDPKADWKEVLPMVREVFGEEAEPEDDTVSRKAEAPIEGFGEVQVQLQTFRGLPIQVKLTWDGEEKRVALPQRFVDAVMKAQEASPNMVMERRWEDRGVRFGNPDKIGEEMVEEISAAYDSDRLDRLVKQAFNQEPGEPVKEANRGLKVTLDMLDDPDWKKRYAALDQMHPTLEDLEVLAKALQDPKSSIRRLATAYLGSLEDPKVLPYLYQALKDPSVTVRRTAGDCLSDLGDPDAIGPMIEALKDKSKLVRWRAAMFLYETGDASAVPALREAQDDPEFEVSMQVKMALERIEGGEEASGSVWQKMTRRNEGADPR
ncbi:PBS lyase HEAT-like repeat-containing protein [Melghirimyces thermohalophilus]|uniref:PBS lyase HEAT-like repeat-containing protein n=1 Tax=Melghirimyces thermohalophilus TaxID=1236220 RepID=A0A1G6QQX6_9BACL|nr:conserved virulence factor C family protein [Melghirimyces thermohalophilus]SDC94374.1 PBS lyase HEAT-like repeat-containing protein [Melghirimyces thermohalophilus]